MKNLFERFLGAVDTAGLLRDTEALWTIERGQTFRDYRRAARFVERLLVAAGLERVERIAVPADGKTVCQDKTMPLAWNATRGTLEVVRSPHAFPEPVVADFQRHPFHLVKDSAATPPGGVLARLVLEDDLYTGADARDALVLLNPATRPVWQACRTAADRGARGLVSDNLAGRWQTPDACQWVNAFTEGPHWHRKRDDRPLLGFSVSPRTGERLRQAARAGQVVMRAVSDARLSRGVFDTVTGVIPGSDPRELWLMAHLYEPLADDNSAGVACAVEIARTLRRMYAAAPAGQPRFTLRLLFSLEMYGFAAYAEKRGGCLRDQVLGAWNLDGLPVVRGSSGRLYFSPAGAPCFADYLVEDLLETGLMTRPAVSALEMEGAYFDDLFLADATTGLSTYWLLKDTFDPLDPEKRRLWHNSAQTMALIDPERFRRTAAFVGAWAASVLGLTEAAAPALVRRAALRSRARLLEEVRRGEAADQWGEAAAGYVAGMGERLAMRFRREAGRLNDFCRVSGAAAIGEEMNMLARARDMLLAEHEQKVPPAVPPAPVPVEWRTAAALVPRRRGRGLPYDLAAVPRPERKHLPDNIIYGPLARVLARADGVKDLACLLREAQWETGSVFSRRQVRAFTGAVQYLSRYGYLGLECREALDRDGLAAALRAAGLAAGDLVMVHSSLSALGPVDGGADGVIGALLEVLGPGGTLLMPTLTHSVVRFGGRCQRFPDFRPFHPRKSAAVTGAIPERFRQRPGVRRSGHPTHSAAGCGPLAARCLAAHRPGDSPVGGRSPFGKLVECGGKMAWVGADLAATTFLHFLEDQLRLPYLEPAVCIVEGPGGRTRPLVLPRHLPGHRDFYDEPALESRVYRRLVEEGLEIKSAPAGFGAVKVIEARAFQDLGRRVLSGEPDILLCRDDSCLFCREGRGLVAKWRQGKPPANGGLS